METAGERCSGYQYPGRQRCPNCHVGPISTLCGTESEEDSGPHRPCSGKKWAKLAAELHPFADLGVDDLGDGDLLDALAAWIESYLQTTEPLESQWWDMIQDERDFWDELPSLVEALIHRRYLIGQSFCTHYH